LLTEAAQHVLDYAIDALCLTIGLRMASGREVQLSTKESKDFLPKGTSEARISVRHQTLGHPMVPEHMVQEESS
jgi:hypothetical protein